MARLHERFAWIALAVALAAYPALLIRYIGANSATFDEGTHLAAGYSYWHCGDYGVNPEHPPLVKLIAAAPLRNWRIGELAGPCGGPVRDEIAAALRLTNGPGFEPMLTTARRTLIVFPLLLLLTVFFAARAWFGPMAAGWAVILTLFDPNLTAHAVLVTTDMGLTVATILGVFCAWQFCRNPGLLRMLWLGLAMGLALAVKHSGILVPAIALLAILVFALCGGESRWRLPASRHRAEPPSIESSKAGRSAPLCRRLLMRLGAGWIGACVIALIALWGVYRFRYEALPGAAPLGIAGLIGQSGMERALIGEAVSFLAAHRLMPEAWLYGFIYVLHNTSRSTYLFGRELPDAVWYYYPAVLSIKTPLSILLLLCAALAMPGFWKRHARACAFLGLPILVFLASGIASGIGLGLRHVLPLYPSLIVLAAGVAAYVGERLRRGVLICAALAVLGAISYARSFPNEIAYANEAWGGPSRLRFYLSDSNLDWSQNLYRVKDWVARHPAKPCWIAWFGMQKPETAGIPCQSLAGSAWLESEDAAPAPRLPEHFGGTVLIGSGLLDYDLYPYRWFRSRQPDDAIGGSVLVFRGEFDRPEVAAERRMSRGWWFMRHHQAEAAAVDLAAAAPHANERQILGWLSGWAAEETRSGASH